jgi:hypothetical protein
MDDDLRGEAMAVVWVRWRLHADYRLDINRNVLLDSEIDLEELARKLGVMGAWEHKL